MTENKAQLSNWIEDIFAFHKAKRKFVSLKDMEKENPDELQICEFKGQNFELFAD